ncbi:MAG: hypothetical protein AB7T37_09640 [Dehalococcoidia bacterium]
MPIDDESKRPVRESILAVAAELEAAAGLTSAVGALRDGSAAIEHHLDTLAKETGSGASHLAPRILPIARDIQERLRALLVRCWEAERASRDGSGAEDLRVIARDLREVASDDMAMVFDSLSDVGGEGD